MDARIRSPRRNHPERRAFHAQKTTESLLEHSLDRPLGSLMSTTNASFYPGLELEALVVGTVVRYLERPRGQRRARRRYYRYYYWCCYRYYYWCYYRYYYWCCYRYYYWCCYR
jgi:hypothetical protein